MNQFTLNQLIKKTGLQKQFVARKSRLTSSELSHIIHRRRKAKPEVIRRIKKVLETYISKSESQWHTKDNL